MTRRFSRRHVLGAGGAAALVPLGSSAAAAAPPPAGPLITLISPMRVFDSRSESPTTGGGRLISGDSVLVTVSAAFEVGFALAVFANVTVTQTQGSGYLVVRGADSSGEVPLPPTSNVNWTTNNQTLANLVLTTVGSENAIEVYCDGGGSTHFIVDIQGYVPFGVV